MKIVAAIFTSALLTAALSAPTHANEQSSSNFKNIGNWKVSTYQSKLDKSKAAIAVIFAETASTGSQRDNVEAVLAVKCQENKTSVAVIFTDNLVANQSVDVDFRVGENSPSSAKWVSLEDNTGYGIFDKTPAASFAKLLIGQKDFYVRGKTRIFSSSEAYFLLDGAEDALKVVRENCNW